MPDMNMNDPRWATTTSMDKYPPKILNFPLNLGGNFEPWIFTGKFMVSFTECEIMFTIKFLVC